MKSSDTFFLGVLLIILSIWLMIFMEYWENKYHIDMDSSFFPFMLGITGIVVSVIGLYLG